MNRGRFILRLCFFSCIALISYSCRNDIYVPDSCYDQTIRPIIISNCTGSGCHNSKDRKEGLDLTTYEGLMNIVVPKHPLQSELYEVIRASGVDRMPPDHSLSAKEIRQIKSWISLGASDNSCASQVCDTVNVSYSKHISVILQKQCLGCHNSGNIILNNYNDVKLKVLTGALIGSVKQNGTFQKMPPSYKLSDCEIRTIEIWVNAGAPNN